MACLVILRVRFNVNIAVWWESKRKPPVAALFLIILRKPNDRERAFIDHSADLIVTGMLRGPSSSAASRTETFSDPVNHPPWTSYGKKVAEYLPLCGLRPPIWSSPIKSVIYLLKILDYQTNSIYIQITKTRRNFNHIFCRETCNERAFLSQVHWSNGNFWLEQSHWFDPQSMSSIRRTFERGVSLVINRRSRRFQRIRVAFTYPSIRHQFDALGTSSNERLDLQTVGRNELARGLVDCEVACWEDARIIFIITSWPDGLPAGWRTVRGHPPVAFPSA